MTRPFRIIAAVAVYDGHDASILALNKALMAGPEPLELIYLGYNMGAEKIALAATRESADAIAVASYNGGHLEFYPRLLNLLKKLTPVPLVFAGGGATIFPQEKETLKRPEWLRYICPEQHCRRSPPTCASESDRTSTSSLTPTMKLAGWRERPGQGQSKPWRRC